MTKPVIYTTTWCEPCKVLKSWIEQRGYSVEYRDGDKEKPVLPLGTILMYPFLVAGKDFVGGVEPIQKWLEEN
tara:strand:+ start:387 stop:605 length:219 start_codon:yes stop_codon:yes gene_type:complete